MTSYELRIVDDVPDIPFIIECDKLILYTKRTDEIIRDFNVLYSLTKFSESQDTHPYTENCHCSLCRVYENTAKRVT